MNATMLRITLWLTLLSAGAVAAEKLTPPKGWKLVWRDEFNPAKLDPKKWNVLLREQSKHNELQQYVPDEVYVENGRLRLRSRVRDYGTLHYYTFDGQKKSSSGTWRGDIDFTKDFHVFALEWEPNELRWFIDGKLLHATTNGIPHTPHFLILNTAGGGAWPGNPDATTVFPQYHDIDYVRVYQRDGYFKQ